MKIEKFSKYNDESIIIKMKSGVELLIEEHNDGDIEVTVFKTKNTLAILPRCSNVIILSDKK